MPNYIKQWKINNQIADLRDGTKGQPNGAVPLDGNGKIAYNLAKYCADQIAVSRVNSDSIAKWASSVAEEVTLPVPSNWEVAVWLGSACDIVRCVNGIFIAVGTFGASVSTDGFSFSKTNITSWPTSGISIYIFDVCFLGGVYFILTNIGLWASNDAYTWSRVSNSSTSYIAYDGTRYVANFSSGSSYLANSTDGFTWADDTFFSSLGSINVTQHQVYGVWYVDGVWWLNAYYTSGNAYYMWAYDGTTFNVIIGSNDKQWCYVHRTHNIDGLRQGDIWLIASEGEQGFSTVLYSTDIFNTQWQDSGGTESVTAPFVEHKGKLYIGNMTGIAVLQLTGNYWFETHRLSDVIGQNPCKSLLTTGEFLLVCGGYKVLYSQEGERWYRSFNASPCYSLAYFNGNLMLSSYVNNAYAVLRNSIVCSKPLYL